MNDMSTSDHVRLFERPMSYPDPRARERFAQLVGIDFEKAQLAKLLSVLVYPDSLNQWAKATGGIALADMVRRRPPLVVLAGDVGTGKTALAESVGDTVAREMKIEMELFPLSLATRGSGRVGELTRLISDAFEEIYDESTKLAGSDNRSKGGIIFLIDEADALAQSREEAQMHHEDRAGVNALIRGIDRLAEARLPAAIIMCTNRLSALDPAIQRRAAQVFFFRRPTEAQRETILRPPLQEAGVASSDIADLVRLTGETGEREYGFTYSDLTQRLLPELVLAAYPNKRVDGALVRQVISRISPTPPFRDEGS